MQGTDQLVGLQEAAERRVADDLVAAVGKRPIGAVKNADANTAYLAAVVAARTSDAAAVAQNLKKAVSLDSSLKAKAQKDLEFAKYQDAVNAL